VLASVRRIVESVSRGSIVGGKEGGRMKENAVGGEGESLAGSSLGCKLVTSCLTPFPR